MIVALINSFNRVDLLRCALPSVASALGSSRYPGAITVFDAGSADGSREYVQLFQKEHPEIRLILVFSQLGEPNSFSDGINRGCAAALVAFPNLRWLFLFETDNWISDIAPINDAIGLMETNRDIGAVGFTVRKYDGSGQGYGCSFPTAWEFMVGPHLAARLRLDRSEGPGIYASTNISAFQCDAVYTSPIVIRREAWETSGGLDAAQFPFSDCDIDWAWRLKKSGWRQAVIRTNKVVHDNKERLSNWSETRVFHLHRARLRLLRLHRGTPPWLIKMGLRFRHFGELLGLALLIHQPKLYFSRLKKRGRLLIAVSRNYES